MTADSAANQPQPAAGQAPLPAAPNSILNAILRGAIMYMVLNTITSFSKHNANNNRNNNGVPDYVPTAPSHHGNSMNENHRNSPKKMKPRGVLDDATQPISATNTATDNQSKSSRGKSGMVPYPSCLWGLDGDVDVHVYFTDDKEYSIQNCMPKEGKGGKGVLAEWHESDLKLSPPPQTSSQSTVTVGNQCSSNVTIPLSYKVQFNETHIYAHICMVNKASIMDRNSHEHRDDLSLSKDILLKTVQLTQHKKRKRIRNEKNLLSGASSSIDKLSDVRSLNRNDIRNNISNSRGMTSPLTIASANTTEECTLLYIKPSLSLQLVNLKRLPFNDRRAMPESIAKHLSWYDDDDQKSSTLYYPLLYSSEFWILKSSLVEVNDTIDSTNVEININDVSFWKWQLMTSMEDSWRKQDEFNGGEDEKGTDMLRTMLLETNPILLIVTAIVSVLHSIFDILAFKNDINFFKGKKSMEGLSLRSMVVNTAFQVVILLYLLDNETSFMILVSNGVGVAIEIWKISKAITLSIFDENGNWNFQWKESDSYSKSPTKEYDEIATDHLMFVTMPLVCGYGLYSLFHQLHKGWYSWILNTLVGFIYMFGFVLMTPQLFINYKLQSVAHLNWRTMTYKSINTFIDDLFAFVIKMPMMHRLACLRDDVIFLIFCYQRYKYKTDYTRVNEYGQCAQPTEEMLKESRENEDEQNEQHAGDDVVSGNLTMRRGARDKKTK